jgi:hypothetical protein
MQREKSPAIMEKIPVIRIVVLLLFVQIATAQNFAPPPAKADTVELHYPNVHGFEQAVNVPVNPGNTISVPPIRNGWIPQLVIIGKNRYRSLEEGTFTQNSWQFTISGDADTLQRILWRYRPENFAESGNCNVDIVCPEGLPYQSIGASVFRLTAFVDGFIYDGTGVLVNNTSEDRRPLLLTAEHNGMDHFYTRFANQQELDNWIFEFNVESEKCNSFSFIRGIKRYFGAKLLARSFDGGGETGTDFALLELNDNRFTGSDHSFAGWSRDTTAPQNGVCIHHPGGGIKKISFYNTPAQPGIFIAQPIPMHWEVFWSATASGHGVTEPGSSGSPLFNQDNLIVGTLSGGGASCSQLFLSDFYGMFSLQWDQTGPDSAEQLAPWLDPLQTGQTTLSGQILTTKTHNLFSTGNIYPNPSEAGKTLILEGFPNTTVHIYNASGQHIDSYSIEKNAIFEIPVPQRKGLYILKYENDRQIHTQKLIVQ